jgi:hypothetical protein
MGKSDFEDRLAELEDRVNSLTQPDPQVRMPGGRVIKLSEVSWELERLQLRVTALRNALTDAGIPIPLDAQERADAAAAEQARIARIGQSRSD